MRQLTSQKRTPAVGVDIIDLPYHPETTALAAETFTLSSLVQRLGASGIGGYQRLKFELLLWCTGGAGTHEVDFESVELVPGRIIHVRTGQVHRWVLDEAYEAQLVLLRTPRQYGVRNGETCIIGPDGATTRDLQQTIELLARNDRSTQLSLRSLEAIRHLLLALLDSNPDRELSSSHRENLYRDFELLLGGAEAPPRTVQQCARLLGCSTKTLTRTCQSIAGTAPKALLDQAVALEAQRQISLANTTIASIAEDLGFSELSNFTRFFRRLTGETPSAFATRVAGPDLN